VSRTSSTYTALLAALAAELKQISTANPFAINLKDAIPILSFIGSLTFIWLVGLVYFRYLNHLLTFLHSRTYSYSLSRIDRIERRHIMKTAWDPTNQPIHSSEFLKNGFPNEVIRDSDEVPLHMRIWYTVIEEHYLTNFINGGASLLRSRLNRWLECWYNIIVMLFIDSLFYGMARHSLTHLLTHSLTHSLSSRHILQ